jgi:hypothetical protein
VKLISLAFFIEFHCQTVDGMTKDIRMVLLLLLLLLLVKRRGEVREEEEEKETFRKTDVRYLC